MPDLELALGALHIHTNCIHRASKYSNTTKIHKKHIAQTTICTQSTNDEYNDNHTYTMHNC